MYERLDDFLYWISERECIRIRKAAGDPKPWSNDPVFQTAYFCNVHREDDKVTKWIRRNWTCHDTVSRHLVAMALARFVNKPKTLEALTFNVEQLSWRACHMPNDTNLSSHVD